MPWREKSYDVLPALSIRGLELRKSLRLVTIAWMYGIVWMSCTTGSHVKIYARMLGFNDFLFGLLTAIPFIAGVGQLLAAVLIERSGLKKYQFLECGTAHRLSWLAVAAIPLALPVPSRWAVAAMLGVMAVSWFMASLASPACMTWLGDLVPRRIRGRYFASRFMYARPIQITVVMVLGIVLNTFADASKPESKGAQPVLMWVICGIFAVAAVFGATDILLFRKVREVVRCRPDGVASPAFEFDEPAPDWWNPLSVPGYAWRLVAAAFRQLVRDPLRNRVFRNYVGYSTTLAFGVAVPGWFFWLNAMENLRFSPLAVNTLFLVISPVLGLIGAKWWGKALDRWGRKPVLVVATVGTWLSVMPWFFATYGTPSPRFVADAVNWLCARAGELAGIRGFVLLGPGAPVGAYLISIFAAVFGGIAWTGVQLAQNNVTLSFADTAARSKYVAASSVMISLGGALGGALGGFVAWLLGHIASSCGMPVVDVGPFHWNQWHATFAISWVTRMFSVLWLLRMHDPGAASTRELVRHMTVNMYNALATWLFFPRRIFGWGRGGGGDYTEGQ